MDFDLSVRLLGKIKRSKCRYKIFKTFGGIQRTEVMRPKIRSVGGNLPVVPVQYEFFVRYVTCPK